MIVLKYLSNAVGTDAFCPADRIKLIGDIHTSWNRAHAFGVDFIHLHIFPALRGAELGLTPVRTPRTPILSLELGFGVEPTLP